jgi:rare lipoprotein A
MRARRAVQICLVLSSASAGLVSEVGPACAESGIAAIYSYRGGRTASGEASRPAALTAAHRTLPFGTKVRVTNARNGHTVVVRINDRGPFTRGRVIDLTPAAAGKLGFSGLTHVTLDVIDNK